MKRKFDRESIRRKQRIQLIISIIASFILLAVFYLFFSFVLGITELESWMFSAALAVLITEFMDHKFYKYQKTRDAIINSLLLPLVIMIIYLILHYTGY